MSDLHKKSEMFIKKLNCVQSEKEASTIIQEMMPDIDKLKDKLFDKNDNPEKTDTQDEDWIDNISEYIIDTIKLYLSYHVIGKLEQISLLLSEEFSPVIKLTIDMKEYTIDFEEIKNGTNKSNRDAHRECYYRNEIMWLEYRKFNPSSDINTDVEYLRKKLNTAFPSVIITTDLS